MKELVTEVTFTFAGNSLEITGFDAERVSIVCLKTVSENAAFVEVPIQVSVYIQDIYRFIRTVEKQDELIFTVEGEIPLLTSRILSHREDRQSWYKYPLLKTETAKVVFPVAETYEQCVRIPTAPFQKAVREIGHSHLRMVLQLDPKAGVILSSTSGEEGGGKVTIKALVNTAYRGTFFTRYLHKFLRVAASNTICIQTKPEFPLTLRYDLENHQISIAISPIQTDL